METSNTTALDALNPKLKAVKLAGWRQIQAEVGVPVGTIRRLVYGDTPNPRMQTIERLERWFDKREAA